MENSTGARRYETIFKIMAIFSCNFHVLRNLVACYKQKAESALIFKEIQALGPLAERA
jgi:hypothetical protein